MKQVYMVLPKISPYCCICQKKYKAVLMISFMDHSAQIDTVTNKSEDSYVTYASCTNASPIERGRSLGCTTYESACTSQSLAKIADAHIKAYSS